MHAHPDVSPLIVEAEFNTQHQFTLRVNLDPRLLMSDQPGTLPPATAAWFLDQNENARTKTIDQARKFLEQIMAIKFGDVSFMPAWTFTAIDGFSNLPLAANSAETHLLATLTQPVPAAAGDFKVTLDSKCPVSLLLLKLFTGEENRRPQVLFPGETSRAFPQTLILSDVLSTKDTSAIFLIQPWLTSILNALKAGSAHDLGDHLLLAFMLALGLRTHLLRSVALLFYFHAFNALAVVGVVTGLLPHDFAWANSVYWIALVCTALSLFFYRDKIVPLQACMAVAGMCHALNFPHLHLPDASAGVSVSLAMCADLLLVQFTALFVFAGIVVMMHKLVHPHGQHQLA